VTSRRPRTAGVLHPGQPRRRAAAVNPTTMPDCRPGLTAASTGTPFKAEEPGPQHKINNRLHRKLDNLDLRRKRHPASADRTAVADHHRQGGALAQDDTCGVPYRPRLPARHDRGAAGRVAITIKALEKEITELTTQLAPALLELPGCGALTAAKIIGETAGVDRFKSRDAYARYNGTAPLPVWSSNKARHRLSRTGNRQLNAALHRIALTQARWHPPAKEMIERRKNGGNSGREALRVLKRRLSDAVFQALLHDQDDALIPAA
jgi:transposase